jgi:hypothetical protein
MMNALLRTHDPRKCHGQACVIHNPSDHHMRDWPVNWREDLGVMERICEHGVGHPDPDDLAHKRRIGLAVLGEHGCDFCCCLPE